MFHSILRWIYPPRCPVCDGVIAEDLLIHEKCRKKLVFVEEPRCCHCGKTLPSASQEYCLDCSRKRTGENPIRQGRGLLEYSDSAKKMMYRFKYSNRSCYSEFFARETEERYEDWLKRISVDVIIPVPMNKRKEKRRGYNQAREFANYLGRRLHLPVDGSVVKRVKDTKALKLLSPQERKNNLKNAFQVDKNIVEYRKILLVDDIYTTGSTVETIAEQLLKAGAGEVYFFTVCIGNGF